MTATEPADRPDALNAWRTELIVGALIGTGRRQPPAVPAALGVAPDGDKDTATSLLDQAALSDALSRGGMLPGVGTPLPAAEPEKRSTAPAQAAELLGFLLANPPVPAAQRLALVRQWLTAAAERGMLVPPRFLPALVDLVRDEPTAQADLTAVWGARGAWFAAQTGGNPADGRRALRPDLPLSEQAERWAELDPADAADALLTHRVTDPGGARTLLAAHWSGLSARGREATAAALEEHLTDADEPFLEGALDDASRSVRGVAAELLSQLPRSAYAGRMAARLAPLVTFNRRLFKRTLTVQPPAAIDDAAVRDGIPAPARDAEPDRMAWLGAIVAAAPLATWTELAQLNVQQTLDLILPDTTVARALVVAVRRQRDPEWAAAMLQHPDGDAIVAPLAPPAVRESWLIDRLHDQKKQPREIGRALAAIPSPWPAVVADAVLDRLEAGQDSTAGLQELSTLLGAALPESALPRVRALLAGDDNGKHRRALTNAVHVHTIAHSIREAFS